MPFTGEKSLATSSDPPADVFDPVIIRQHVEMIHRLAEGMNGELVVCCYGEDPKQINPESGKPGLPVYRKVQRFRPGAVEPMVSAIMAFDGKPHANVYVPLHVVRFGLEPGKRGQEKDIIATLGLVADMDADTGQCGDLSFEPSLVVETSPGNTQPFILFEKPISPDAAKPLAKALKAMTGSDHGTADICHVWRVPGTLNWPNAAKLARGRAADPAPVTLAKAWNGTLLPIEAVQAALANALSADKPKSPHDGNTDVAAILERLKPATQYAIKAAPPAGEDRSPHCARVIFAMAHAGLTDDEIHIVTAAYPDGLFSRYHVEGKDLTGEIRRARGAMRHTQGDPIDEVVKRFNSKYMVVNEAGKVVIFQPGFDPVLGRRHFDRISIPDLHTLYMNETIQIGIDYKKRPIIKTVSEVWLKHVDRRQYISGVTFDPTDKQTHGVLNLWQGYAVKPVPGDWSLMQAHIRNVICNGDTIRFDYLMGWMARMLQRPAEQGEVAVVMQGGEGTGKGTLAKALMKITGHHGLAISNAKHLIGNFNAHLRDAVFLFADEAFFAGDRAHLGVLKSLITEPYLTVEAKFANVIQAPNFLHVIMASNEDWVVPASRDARRFFVLEMSSAVKNDHNYFAQIWAQMEAGGYEAMLQDLMDIDLTNFNVRAVPITAGLQRQRKFSMPVPEAWWLEALERGYIFRSKLGLEHVFSKWLEKISVELVYASYTEFAKGRAERRLLTREDLGRFLKSMGAEKRRWRQGIVGERLGDVGDCYGRSNRKAEIVNDSDRTYGYLVGELSAARAAFVEATKLPIAWDSDETVPEEMAA